MSERPWNSARPKRLPSGCEAMLRESPLSSCT
jgi:hypothetical protein